MAIHKFTPFGAVFVLLCTAAPAASPAFNPLAYKGQQAGPATKVLVVGTAHIGAMPDTFRAEWLAPLLDKLKLYKPQVIAIESLSGETCFTLRAYAKIHGQDTLDYCKRIFRLSSLAEKTTGLSMPEAAAEAERLVALEPKSAAERRRLAAVFAAAGDVYSAAVQWLRLAPSERKVADGIDEPLRVAIEETAANRNENSLIAAVLAARLGLERVYPVDDHTADLASKQYDNDCAPVIEGVWKRIKSANFDRYKAVGNSVKDSATLLTYFQLMNEPRMQRTFVETDQIANMREPSTLKCGRQYMGWWEVRNLRMVANLRATFQSQPGVRVLAIVGASHKAHYDAYLNQIHEVQLVDATRVLK